MANLKISQLTAGSPAQAGDLFPIDRAGANFSINVNSLILTTPTSSQTITGAQALILSDPGSTFWEKGAIGAGSLGTPGTDPDDAGSVATLTLDEVHTDPTHQVYGASSTVDINPTGDMATYVIGVASQCTIDILSTHNFTNTEIGIGAGYFESDNNGTGTVALLYGLHVDTFNNANNVTTMNALIVTSQSFASGTTTNNAGISVTTGQGSGGGTIVNDTGIDIATRNAGGALTNSVGLHIAGVVGPVANIWGLKIENQGATGFAIQVLGGKNDLGPQTTTMANSILTAAAPTAAAGQIGYGSTTAATASAGGGQTGPATVAGYIIVNVAGTARKVPFYA